MLTNLTRVQPVLKMTNCKWEKDLIYVGSKETLITNSASRTDLRDRDRGLKDGDRLPSSGSIRLGLESLESKCPIVRWSCLWPIRGKCWENRPMRGKYWPMRGWVLPDDVAADYDDDPDPLTAAPGPITSQYSGHVISIDQSEASITCSQSVAMGQDWPREWRIVAQP